MIKQNLTKILSEISEIARSCGREPSEIKLIAVSKTKPMSLVREAFEAGQVDFGENRPQELQEKHPELPEAQWHMIGRLQRNKVRHIAPFIHLIHSVDSEKLLKEINKRAKSEERIIDCLLQINISDEDQKGGLEEPETVDLLKRIASYPNVRVKGLMGMAEFTSDRAVIRRQFKRLAEARKRFRAFENDQIQMEELSMGMSGDFDIAIEEGATMVRIGSAIFGSR